MSNMNADTKVLVPHTETLQTWLRQFLEDVMDQQVVKTDMKLRHIVNKAVEVINNKRIYRKKFRLIKSILAELDF